MYTRLLSSEVHVWRIDLRQPEEIISVLYALLSADEQVRAKRYIFERDRRKFVVCRGTLRRLIGEYLDAPPESIVFAYSGKGKPSLEPASDLCFNVSHSGELAAIAFARNCDLGVDLEVVRPMKYLEDIARRIFEEHDYQKLLAESEDQRLQTFFRTWTGKEAFGKATGEGLFTKREWNDSEWILQGLELGQDYLGSICYHAPEKTIRLITLPADLD